MEMVLIHCRNFFQHELKGSRVLLPNFFKAIKQVFGNTGNVKNSVLRSACISILSSIYCMGYYFDGCNFSVTKREGLITSYSELHSTIDTEILMVSFESLIILILLGSN